MNNEQLSKSLKKDTIFTLAPQRVQFDQFWIEIRKRNRWLIMLRYCTFIILTLVIAAISTLQYINDIIYIDTLSLWIIDFLILLYNFAFHKIWHLMPGLNDKFGIHSLHLSLFQIIFDLLALSALIYYTGGVENPLYGYFIFHVIIGSLFLTGIIIRIIVVFFLITTITGSIFEIYGIIPHHSINGLLEIPLYNNSLYVLLFFLIFGSMLLLSTYFANSIARELYQQELSLSNANKKLQEAEKVKSRYVMSVVHDLKTPIVSAINYLNLLLDGTLGEIKPNHTRPMERSRIRLNNAITMINDILQMSQLQMEENFDKIEEIDLVKLFDKIYNDFKQIMNIKRMNYYFEIESRDGIMIQGEPKLLNLALSNLVSNACKYTEDSGEIVVKVEESKDFVTISVADTGIGIPENEREKIFRDFYRTPVSKEKGYEGTGLGLSIVLNIIQKHHGEIKVESPSYLKKRDEYPGTEFIIKLPKIYSPEV